MNYSNSGRLASQLDFRDVGRQAERPLVIPPLEAVRLLDQAAWESLSQGRWTDAGSRVPLPTADRFLVLGGADPPSAAIYLNLRSDGIVGLGPRLKNHECDAQDRSRLWRAALNWAQRQGYSAFQVFTDAGGADAACLVEMGLEATTELVAFHRRVTLADQVDFPRNPRSASQRPPNDRLNLDPALNALIASTFIESRDLPEALPWRDPDALIAEWTTSRGDQPPATIWRVGEPGPAVGLIVTRTGGPTIEIEYLGVAAHHRRQGWGRQLVETVIATSFQLGINELTVPVDARNHPAVNLYQSLGFVEQSRSWFHFSSTGGKGIMECPVKA